MRKLFRIPAMLLGATAMLFGASCGGDEDEAGLECCSIAFTEEGVPLTDEICSDGSYTYGYSDGEGGSYTLTGNLPVGNGYTWSDLKAELKGDGWDC